MNSKIELPVVKDDDLRSILDRFQLSSSVDAGAVNCFCCSAVITWGNIGAMRVNKQELLLFCDRPECTELASMKNISTIEANDE